MGTEQKKVVVIFWILAVFIISIWSTLDGLRLIAAISRHDHLKKSQLNYSDAGRIDFRRSEQKYFLDYGIYVPLEDIMYIDQLPSGGARYKMALASSCGGATTSDGIAIWLPIRLKFPLIGEKVIEWCWRPPVVR